MKSQQEQNSTEYRMRFEEYYSLIEKIKNTFSLDEFIHMPDEVREYFKEYKSNNEYTTSYDALNGKVKKHISRELFEIIPESVQIALSDNANNQLNEEQIIYISKLPWGKKEIIKTPISECERILNKNHTGMQSVKEQIIRYIACQQHIGDSYGTVLLLCGPPGVGKTTIAKSIAEAFNRQFVKISLAGLSDAISLKGVSTIYSGAKPGLIVEAFIKAQSFAPVILLDEIDKMGASTEHGNPSNALLEILDSNRNRFADSFLGIEVDLSKVVFIATANDINLISPILRDRLETIKLSGYNRNEKIEIVTKHMVPELQQSYRIPSDELIIPENTIEFIIDNCTNEAGVRTLGRIIKRIFETVIYYKAINTEYNKCLNISDICSMLSVTEKVVKHNNMRINKTKVAIIKKPEDLLY